MKKLTWSEMATRFKSEGHILPLNAIRTHLPLLGFYDWENGSWEKEDTK